MSEREDAEPALETLEDFLAARERWFFDAGRLIAATASAKSSRERRKRILVFRGVLRQIAAELNALQPRGAEEHTV